MGKKKKSKGGSFLMQGSILAAAGIITKIIGAVYRIPMLNIMGLKGQGYYDMAFQVYSIALIISSYSLPVAVSKLVSFKMAAGERKNAFRVLKASLIIAALSGVTIMVIVFFGAEAIAEYLMGAKMSCYSLKVLAPGLLICAIMAVFRGTWYSSRCSDRSAVLTVLLCGIPQADDAADEAGYLERTG